MTSNYILTEISGDLCQGDHEWFFFIPRQEREARGGRPNRLTTSGYWKATGSPGHVYSSGNNSRIIGGKRTMVYYEGRAPHGRKTEWKMNEYKAIDAEAPTSNTSNPPVFVILIHFLYLFSLNTMLMSICISQMQLTDQQIRI